MTTKTERIREQINLFLVEADSFVLGDLPYQLAMRLKHNLQELDSIEIDIMEWEEQEDGD